MARTVSASSAIQIITLLLTLVLVVFVVLAVFDVVKVCGKEGTKAGGKAKKTKKTKKTRQAEVVAAEEEQESEASASRSSSEGSAEEGPLEIEKPLEEQMTNFKNGKLKNLIIIIGQRTCPACVHTKKYFREKGLGNHAIFVDLADPKGPEAMKQLPKDVVSKLQGGVPCMVAYQHGKGAQYSVTGFSEPEVEKLVKAAGIKKTY